MVRSRMLLPLVVAAYVVAALAAVAAAVRHTAHRTVAAAMVTAAAVDLGRAVGLHGAMDTAALLTIPGIGAALALRVLGQARRRWALSVGAAVTMSGAVATLLGPGVVVAYTVAHLAAVAVECWAAGTRFQRRERPVTLAEGSVLVLGAGDLSLALAAPLVAAEGWPVAQVQGITTLAIVATVEGLAAQRRAP